MAAIPIFFEAKQISTMNVLPCSAAANGTLTEGTAVSLKTLETFDSLRVEFDRGLFPVVNADALVSNYQQGLIDFTGTLSALDRNGKVQALLDFYGAYDYVKIVAQGTQYGSGGAAQKILTLYAAIGTTGSGYVAGPNITVLTLRPCGIAPVWASP